ncbi:MAG: hypothetical protein OEZ16_08045 [Chromatiales bacterium]|nr:hypothetical protein [Chromatiales bacterium]
MSTIKFHHLQIGEQFEFRGDHYTKVSPLLASNNSNGQQKMIPRSALVEVAAAKHGRDSSPAANPSPALAVLERYHQTMLAELQSLSDDEERLGAVRNRLEGLRVELAAAIKQG